MTDSFPAHWLRRSLGDVAEVQTGLAKNSRKPAAAVLRPYLRVANVQDGYLDLSSVKTIEVDAADVKRFELQPGDVLLTEGGDNDKLGRGTVWHGEIPGCLHQNHVFAVRPQPEWILPEYLAALIRSRYGRRHFDASAKQTTNLASINTSQVRSFPVIAPPLGEQRRVTGLLGEFGRANVFLGRLLVAKRRFKRGLMSELLTGKRRFRDFTGKPWREVRIGDLLEEVSRPIAWDDDATYDLVSIRRRSGGVFHRSQMRGKDIAIKQLFQVHTGDFLISRMQVVHGALGAVPPELDGMMASGSYVVLRVRDSRRLSVAFFDQLSRLPHMYRLALLSSYGVHIEKMTFNLEWYLKSRVNIPLSTDEQDDIAAALSLLDNEIETIQRLRSTLDGQRRGVMELLLTGKVRIPAEA